MSAAGTPPDVMYSYSQNDTKFYVDAYGKPYGIHFRHHNTLENSRQYSQAINPLLLGERPLVAALQELNRQMNDKLDDGTSAPYEGLKHPIQP